MTKAIDELRAAAFKIKRETGWTNLLVSLADAERIVTEQEQRIGELEAQLAECNGEPYSSKFNELPHKTQIEMLHSAALENSKPVEGTCEWKENSDGYYDTACGEAFETSTPESLTDNGFKFCLYCGKAISEIVQPPYAAPGCEPRP